MWVYGIEEHMYRNDKTDCYDRVIIFHLLRSTVTLIIKDGVITTKQEVYCKEFYNSSIADDEQYAVYHEKGAIEFFAIKQKKLLESSTPIKEIISIDYENYPECLILQNQKMVVTKIEEVREQVMKDFYKKQDEFESTFARSPYKNYLRAALRIDDAPRGDQIIRFCIPIIKKGKCSEAIMDVHLRDSGIVQRTEDCYIREEAEPIIYFCHKYFGLLRSEIPINEILKLDSGKTLIYKHLSLTNRKKRF